MDLRGCLGRCFPIWIRVSFLALRLPVQFHHSFFTESKRSVTAPFPKLGQGNQSAPHWAITPTTATPALVGDPVGFDACNAASR